MTNKTPLMGQLIRLEGNAETDVPMDKWIEEQWLARATGPAAGVFRRAPPDYAGAIAGLRGAIDRADDPASAPSVDPPSDSRPGEPANDRRRAWRQTRVNPGLLVAMVRFGAIVDRLGSNKHEKFYT